ncbi:MAG TPA: RHS repeat-associated core domain-containing protein [Bryobacteraceae bacterium]|nr:RHS repeat-associated core domain-containing protein [Bryobacteraceae bacterium]
MRHVLREIRQTGISRLTQVVDSISGTITLTWDDFDRLTREVTPQGTVDYVYDAAGRRVTMTVAGQPIVNYSYDNADRLTGITQGSSTVTFEYDNADRRTKTTLPNGVSMEYFYDHAGQLTRIDYKQGTTLIGDLTYEYDAAGNRIAMGGSFGRTGLPQPLASAVYDAANRLTQWGGTTLSYDDNGNLTSDATNSYTWSARNQLASMTGASFQYDAFGRRKSKTIGGASTQFLYDGVNVVQELSGTTANLLTGLGVDEMFTRTDSAGAGHYLTDGLGSTLALTDPTGAVQTRYTYEPYGKVSVSGTSSANPFQYTGRENDGTGLYYYRARYYHPVLQRFISEDPIEFEAGDPNFYGYVFNDPIGAYDPDGLSIAGKIFKQTVKGAWRLIRNKTAQQQLAKKCDLNYATPSGGRRGLRAMKKLSPGETVKGHTKDVTAREYGPHVQTSPNPKRNHLFFGRELYSITGPLTLSYYAEGRGWWTETASALADLFNPLSIPNDIVEVADELNGIAHEVLPFSGRK